MSEPTRRFLAADADLPGLPVIGTFAGVAWAELEKRSLGGASTRSAVIRSGHRPPPG